MTLPERAVATCANPVAEGLMRSICLVAVSVVGSLLGIDATVASQDLPKSTPVDGHFPCVVVDSCEVDFGDVYRGEKLLHLFHLRNLGNGNLKIHEVRTSCSCAVRRLTVGGITFDDEDVGSKKGFGELKPEDEAVLEVELKTAASVVPAKDGSLRKTLHVYTNDQVHSPLVLTLTANVITPFTVDPERIDFGLVKKGSSTTRTIYVSSDKLGNFDITDARSGDERLLKITLARLPDENAQRPTWAVTATLAPESGVERTATFIGLTVNHERVKEIMLPVYFVIERAVTFIGNRKDGSEFLDFGTMSGDEDATVSLRIENKDQSVPYIPTEVRVDGRPLASAFRTELVEVERGMRYVVKLTVPKTLSQYVFVMGEVVIASAHPDVPTKKIPFRGWFK